MKPPAPAAARLPLALSLAFSLAAGAAAQDIPKFVKQAREHAAATPNAKGKRVGGAPDAQQCLALVKDKPDSGAFCADFDTCVSYCRCACESFDITKWDNKQRDDGAAVCSGFPADAPRSVPDDSPALQRVTGPYEFIDIDADSAPRATQAVLDGLARLDAKLKNSETRRKLGYRFRVGSCFRSVRHDSQPECGLVLKAKYEVDKHAGDEDAVRHWRHSGNPNNLGLAWPGVSPHSAGVACDLVLVDRKGDDCFDWRAGVEAADGQKPVPTCSIDARKAAKLAVAELTDPSVGAQRLDYEAWHFEWDPDPPSARCSGADCDAYWPLTGHP